MKLLFRFTLPLLSLTFFLSAVPVFAVGSTCDWTKYPGTGCAPGSGEICQPFGTTCIKPDATGTTDSGGTPPKSTTDSGGQPPPLATGGLQNPLKFTSLSSFLTGILDLLSEIGTIVVVLMVVYSGFLFVAARGKPEDLAKARSALFWTVIGALIVLGAKALSLGIQATVDSLRAAT